MIVACAHGSTYFSTCNYTVFERLKIVNGKRFKAELWMQINRRVAMTTKKHIFENTLVWTGPYFSKTTTLQAHQGFLDVATTTT